MTIDTELIWVLLVGMLTALVALVGGIAMIARALTKSSETNISLNNELQENTKERREWEKERQEWQLARVTQEAEIKTLRANYTNDVERLDRQLTGMTASVAQIRTDRDRLQGKVDTLARKVEQLEQENKILRDKIIALETENKDLRGEREILIQKLDNLTRRLDAEITSNNELRGALDALRSRIKDLPSTEELTKAAANATQCDDDPPPSAPLSEPIVNEESPLDKAA